MFKIKSKSPLIIRTGYNIFYFSLKDKKSITKSYFLLTQAGLCLVIFILFRQIRKRFYE